MLEFNVIEATAQAFQLYQSHGITAPVIIMLSLLRTKGDAVSKGLSQIPDYVRSIDRDVLVLPEIVVNELTKDPASVLKPIFDTLWNACGYPGSPFYDAEGKRIESK